MEHKKIINLILVLAIISFIFIGCSKGSVETSSIDQKNTIKTVDTINGEIQIPVHAKRIVVDGYLPTLLALGVKPVGATKMDIENVHIKGMVSGIEKIGAGLGEVSLQSISNLKPDLIITLSGSEENRDKYEQLAKIAPTISIPFETYKDVHSEIEAIADILGKTREGENWLKDYDKRVEAAKAKVNKVIGSGETVSILGAFNKKFYVYGNGGYRGGQAVYRNLNLTPPESIKKELMDKGETVKEILFESIKDYSGDYIFFDESHGGKLDRSNKLWNSIEAVKNNKVCYMDPDFFWAYDPIAVINQTEKVAEILLENGNK